MSVPYYVHAGARLKRILRHKKIVILHYAKKARLTPQGLYRYFSQADIRREKLELLLEAVPITTEDFYHWDSLDGHTWHQGELLLLYLAKYKIKSKDLAGRLQLPMRGMLDWFDTDRFSEEQLQQLNVALSLAPDYFTDPHQLKQGVNWVEAYLDKCMEVQQYIRRVNTLERKINAR